MRNLLCGLLVGAALVPADAYAADTIVYYSSTYMSATDVSDLEAALTGMGATVTTSSSTSWPTSYTGYQLVIILLPEAAFSSAQASALESFVNGGGRLVVAGDWESRRGATRSGFYENNGYVDDLLTDMGVSMSLGSDAVSGSGCGSTTSITADQVTDGVSTAYIAASNSITGGNELVGFTESGKDYTVLAYDWPSSSSSTCPPGEVILSADVNLLIGSCSGATSSGANHTLWENLWYWGACDADGDGSYAEGHCCGDDCDDADASVTSGGSTYYADADADGYGDASSTTDACTAPSGYTTDATDCDDADASVNPGATETCDGVDEDCDGTIDDGVGSSTFYADADGDGYGDGSSSTTACTEPSGYTSDATDCDDGDASVNPGATETCDGVDEDCDGTIDDGVASSTFYADADGDGYGDASSGTTACSEPSGYTSDSSDCDDGAAIVNPGASEIAYDGIDQDCDGDDLCDVDEDGYDHDGASCGGTDCNDADASTHAGATESADGADQDCDGTVDEGTSWYDDDGDGWTEAGGDCDDGDGAALPSGEETCDGVDEDCDGTVDEETDCYDDDGDGWTEDEGDCNDGDASVSPSVTEIDENGVDDDCDGSVDGGVFDADGDGRTEAGGDCDPEDASVYPGAPELADGIDNDCDGEVDEGTRLADDDGDGWTERDGDCDDADADVHPDGTETANGRDDDCDGEVDEGGATSDDDGDGLTEEAGDCDDADPDVHPGAAEVENGVDDDCDEQVDEGLLDLDGDGVTAADGDCDDENGWVWPGAEELCNERDDDCDEQVDEGCLQTGEEEDRSGACGCVTGSGPAWPWLALLLPWLRTRRGRSGVAAAA